MARELKVYGGTLMTRDRGQVRAIVLVATQAALLKAVKATGLYVTAGMLRTYWVETHNDDELAAARAAGPGVVLARPCNDWNGEYRVVVSDNV